MLTVPITRPVCPPDDWLVNPPVGAIGTAPPSVAVRVTVNSGMTAAWSAAPGPS